jgi:hypothetical protein
MNPTIVYDLGRARLAEMRRQARQDTLARPARRVRPGRPVGSVAGRRAGLARWPHRPGRVPRHDGLAVQDARPATMFASGLQRSVIGPGPARDLYLRVLAAAVRAVTVHWTASRRAGLPPDLIHQVAGHPSTSPRDPSQPSVRKPSCSRC